MPYEQPAWGDPYMVNPSGLSYQPVRDKIKVGVYIPSVQPKILL
jgi:hypothetical protein